MNRLSAERFNERIEELQQTITVLRRQLAAQHKYLEELEKQLEPNVIEEIRNTLSDETARS